MGILYTEEIINSYKTHADVVKKEKENDKSSENWIIDL
jgi:hypothetical protein